MKPEDLVSIARKRGIAKLDATFSGKNAFESMMAGRHQVSSATYARMTRIAHDMRSFEEPFELLCKEFLENHIDILPHQLKAAEIVFDQMGLRAILADEVGLGKTIEAGIIAKELEARGMMTNLLVISPKTLMPQWQAEFKEKFEIDLVDIARSPLAGNRGHWIVGARSWYTATSDVRDAVLDREWDLVIIDEAHHLKNIKSKAYQAILPKDGRFKSLKSHYMLLLTATPIQNDLQEIYSLLHLVRPGALGSFPQFRREFFDDQKGQEVKNGEKLRKKISENLIRRRRVDCGISYKDRIPETHHLEFPAPCRRLYESLFVLPGESLQKVHWLRQAASSLESLRQSLAKVPSLMAETAVWDGIRKVEESGEPKLIKLEEIVRQQARTVVFTEYRNTQMAIRRFLLDRGLIVHELHGGMTGEQRRRSILAFRDQGGVFVSTKAGTEGLNLQFSNVLVNFDLPWNPMQVEQRIGRIHRLGQREKVYVHTLSYRGTIEDYILLALYKKLRLFEMSVGEIDDLFTSGASEDDFELESYLRTLVGNRASLKNIEENLRRLSEEVEAGRARKLPSASLTQKVLG